jgi:glycosyltransferase involved in cell wall biosynthesis
MKLSFNSPALDEQAAAYPLLSLVVPVFNEQDVLARFEQRVAQVLSDLGYAAEIIYVDDGSTDATSTLLAEARDRDPRVGIVRLSRNFGKEMAMTAGLRATSGACVIVIDVDLQDPPEQIARMVDAWQAGHDVVNMRRLSRNGESWIKRTTASIYYKLLNRFGDIPIPVDIGDFRLLSRRVVDALNVLPENNRYMKGLFAWVGFRQVTLDYERHSRAAGKAKQNYGRLFALAAQGLTSFSVMPLRLAFVTGLAAAVIAFLMTAFYVGKTLIFGDVVTGFPTLVVAILVLGGLNLLGLGVLGEYIGRLFLEAKRRPLYLVDEFMAPRSGSFSARDDTRREASRFDARTESVF